MKLSGKTGEVELSTDTIAALKARFPTKNVERELALAHLWLLKNPSSRPVRMIRFLENWLRKADSVIRPDPVVVAAWWVSDERTLNQGRALGLEPRPGESMPAFRDRINAKLGRAA